MNVVAVDGRVTGVRRRAAVGAAAVAFAAAVTTAVTGGLPAAAAAPTSDEAGYVDSTARCAAPSVAVAFGSTSSSRVAICKDAASGQYQYRGVRISDGARLILAATADADSYVAENDGITYTVTETDLIVSSGSTRIRKEPMLDFHGGTSGTSGSSKKTPSPTQSSAAPKPSTPSTPSTPLPPPLPAEVGGS